jgi:uncharacterized protein with HEPN domain
MFKRSDYNLLLDISEAISKIERYTFQANYDLFSQDDKTIDAVVRNLEIIGEAASKISEDFKREKVQIEWRKIIGLRNRIIHEYFGIDLKIIWEVVSHYIPELKNDIDNLKSEK